jgi:hypothetical protein
MHPTGMSLPLIENLLHETVVSRRVIGGVRNRLVVATRRQAERNLLSYRAATQRRSNKRLHPTGNSLPLIVNLSHDVVVSRRVNRGVRHAWQQRPEASRNNLLSARVAAKRRSNMPMHPTGNSLPLIVNLSHDAVVSRRVIGGVRHA